MLLSLTIICFCFFLVGSLSLHRKLLFVSLDIMVRICVFDESFQSIVKIREASDTLRTDKSIDMWSIFNGFTTMVHHICRVIMTPGNFVPKMALKINFTDFFFRSSLIYHPKQSMPAMKDEIFDLVVFFFFLNVMPWHYV